MKFCLATLVFGLLLSSVSYGQPVGNSGLVFSGTLVSVTPRINHNEGGAPLRCVNGIPPPNPLDSFKPLVRYELKLYLQLRNDSSVPLILFNPTHELIERRHAFIVDGFSGSYTELGLRPSAWFSKYRQIPTYDPFQGAARALDLREPLSNLLLILEPGRYFEFYETVLIDDGYRLEIRPGQSLKEVATNTPVAEDLAFKMQYRFSMKKRHANDNFLKTLQERWKKFGHLVLDGSGDFYITSEPILNRAG